jgi:hypothetical protein
LLIHAIIFLSFFLLFTGGCNDSDSPSYSPPADVEPPIVEPLTDAEMMFFQDGDGDWRQIDESEFTETGIFIPPVTDSLGRYGVALIIVNAEDQEVNLYTLQTTSAELPQIDVSSFLDDDVATAALTVNVGEPNLADSSVDIFLREEDDWPFDGSGITYSGLEPGIYDLALTQTEWGNKYPSTLLALRDIELDDGDTLVQDITTADFANNSINLSGPYTVTVRDQQSGNPLDSGIYHGEVGLYTTNLTYVELGYKNLSDTDFEYTALGASLTDNDIYLLDLDIDIDDTHSLYYMEAFLDEWNKEITLPVENDFDLALAEDISTGSLLPGMHIPDIEGVTVIGYSVYFDGSINDIQYRSQGFISASRQTDASFFLPDLSSAEEWENHWSIPADVEAEYAFTSAYIGSGNFTDKALLALSGLYVGGTHYQQLEDGDWMAILRESLYSGGGAL